VREAVSKPKARRASVSSRLTDILAGHVRVEVDGVVLIPDPDPLDALQARPPQPLPSLLIAFLMSPAHRQGKGDAVSVKASPAGQRPKLKDWRGPGCSL
jgi:hypothetical protein